jgi:hypothetical protein
MIFKPFSIERPRRTHVWSERLRRRAFLYLAALLTTIDARQTTFRDPSASRHIGLAPSTSRLGFRDARCAASSLAGQYHVPNEPEDDIRWLEQAAQCGAQSLRCLVPTCPFCGGRGARCAHVVASHSPHASPGWVVSPFTTAPHTVDDDGGRRVCVWVRDEHALFEKLIGEMHARIARASHVREKWCGIHQSGFTYFTPDPAGIRAELGHELERLNVQRSPRLFTHSQAMVVREVSG